MGLRGGACAGVAWDVMGIPARFSHYSVSPLALLKSGVDCEICFVLKPLSNIAVI